MTASLTRRHRPGPRPRPPLPPGDKKEPEDRPRTQCGRCRQLTANAMVSPQGDEGPGRWPPSASAPSPLRGRGRCSSVHRARGAAPGSRAQAPAPATSSRRAVSPCAVPLLPFHHRWAASRETMRRGASSRLPSRAVRAQPGLPLRAEAAYDRPHRRPARRWALSDYRCTCRFDAALAFASVTTPPGSDVSALGSRRTRRVLVSWPSAARFLVSGKSWRCPGCSASNSRFATAFLYAEPWRLRR